MRNPRWPFILLLANLAFVAAVLYWSGLLHKEEAVGYWAPPSVRRIEAKTFGRKKPAPAPVPVIVTNAFNWTQLESEDYHEYIARLRKVGCPEETIRDLIIADLDKLFAPRVAALHSSTNEPKYWRADEKALVSHIEALQQLKKKRGVDFEKRQVVRELLGVDLVSERLNAQGEEDFYGRRLGKAIPVEKVERVRQIIEETNQQEMELRERSWLESDTLTAGDKEGLRVLQAEKEQRLAALLSPEELEQYNLWFSPSAYKVRDSFYGMEATEQEFLSLYRLRQAFDERWANADAENLTPLQRQQWNAELKNMESQIQQALGPERYPLYVRAQDNDYRQLRTAAAEFGLPAQAAEDVYLFKQTFAEQRQALMAEQSASPEAKQQMFKAMQAEAEKAVIETIGPKAYQFYLRNGAGQWLYEP